jgi:hypothetical protein
MVCVFLEGPAVERQGWFGSRGIRGGGRAACEIRGGMRGACAEADKRAFRAGGRAVVAGAVYSTSLIVSRDLKHQFQWSSRIIFFINNPSELFQIN